MRIEDHPRVFQPDRSMPFQVRIHRRAGVGLWSEHASMASAKRSLSRLLPGGDRYDYVGPRAFVEVCDARRFRPRRGRP